MTDPDPCRPCPWLNANHGKPHPDGWYTKGNQDRLWAGLRNGKPMSCHPTDPNNEISEQAQAAGYKPAPAGAQVRECRGALVLQQREVYLLDREYDNDVKAYRAGRPHGLTRTGIRQIIARLVFGGVPLVGGAVMERPDLNAPVSHRHLPWTPPPAQTECGNE